MKTSELFDALTHFLQSAHPPTPKPELVSHPDGDGEIVVVREGYHVTKLAGPLMAKRVHVFDDVASLARWLNRHAEDPKTVEVLVDQDRIVASLDPASVTGDRVACVLVRHPSLVTWEEAFEAEFLTQRQLHHVIRSNIDTLGGPEGESLSAEIMKLQVAKAGNLTSEIDATGINRFHAKDGKTEVAGKIPPKFEISTPMIQGVEASDGTEARYPLEVLVQMDVGPDQQPVFKLTCPRIALARVQARRDAAAYLERLLSDGFDVGLGQFITHDVPDGSSN